MLVSYPTFHCSKFVSAIVGDLFAESHQNSVAVVVHRPQ